jgi:hypothetical protein
MLVLAMVGVVNAQTEEVFKVRVTGDRVNLRTKPELNSTSLEPAMRGEELVYIDATNGWVAVEPPDYIDCWVSSEFIKQGVVQPKKLNVRAGPSLNYAVLAVVKAGDSVKERGKFNGWLKIAPPPGCRVWISEQFTELIAPPKPEPVPVVVEQKPEPKPVEVAPEPPEEEELPTLVLVLDKSKEQGVYNELPGVLRRANPGLYKLVLIANGFEEPICLVRGNERQMEAHLNRSLLIKGQLYWAKDVDLPVIIPSKIHLDPILAE